MKFTRQLDRAARFPGDPIPAGIDPCNYSSYGNFIIQATYLTFSCILPINPFALKKTT